ncbi:hypothetical protein TRAPUB_1195 [Trametes pubescens]|uniref:Uncharacterized protein n=1 Tax=Trametes pubescens TaxID=154538 RepID=A0A1M2VK27_TRAPU|nr:hypothetical protein TRAPUB_1195 [Trametes pubescens]
MEETKKLFSMTLREGLITDESDLASLRLNILAAIIRVERIRREVYADRSLLANVKNWWGGLSQGIRFLEDELNNLRAKLAERNSKEREARASQGLTAGLLFFSNNTGFADEHDSAALDGSLWKGDASVASPAQDALRQPKPTDSQPAQARRHTHHMISDADLQSLLFLALAPPLLTEEGKHRRATQRAALRHLSKLYGLDPSSACGGDARFLKRTSKHRTGFKSLGRLLRRAYGVSPPGIGGDAREPLVDPESLLPPYAEGDDDDDAGWDSDTE